LLHELSHGLLNHADYNYDIELIAMECKAWDKVGELAKKYEIVINDNIIQLTLDTYRDWLHSRSTCPSCKATGIQDGKKSYSCLACGYKWRVNEARICALRRYKNQ
jgi:tRNA(Ile2) C34 agmatinyltransferase TiaS